MLVLAKWLNRNSTQWENVSSCFECRFQDCPSGLSSRPNITSTRSCLYRVNALWTNAARVSNDSTCVNDSLVEQRHRWVYSSQDSSICVSVWKDSRVYEAVQACHRCRRDDNYCRSVTESLCFVCVELMVKLLGLRAKLDNKTRYLYYRKHLGFRGVARSVIAFCVLIRN